MVDTVGYVNAVAGSPAYNGRMLRQLNAVAFAGATAARPLGARSGVRPGTSSTTVTATSTTWTCQPFAGILDGQAAAEAGPYAFAFDAVAVGALTAADASNPRTDIIYVQVDDPSESDGTTVPAVTRKYLAGTVLAGGFLTATLPARSILLANINVPKAGGGSPTVTWVAPYCAAAGGVVDFNTKAALDLWTTALPGQRAYVIATGVYYERVGSAWVRDVAGSTLVAAGSFTGATPAVPAVVAGCFSSKYKNYRVVVKVTSVSGPTEVHLRVRAGGTDLSSGSYRSTVTQANSSSPSTSHSASANSVAVARASAAGGGGAEFTIFGPQEAAYTFITGSSSDSDYWLQYGHAVKNTNVYDGFSLFPPFGGTVTGEYWVYGVDNG